jgi:hypothetical protein
MAFQSLHAPKQIGTCVTCKNNNNGICKLTGRDMYENRMLRVDQGGCGESAMKYFPRFVQIEREPIQREAYGWS